VHSMFFFSSRRRHTIFSRDWSSDVCSSDLYARTMRRICWEEAFHLKHGEDIVLTAMMGTAKQRAMMQEALERWWEPLMMFYGPPTPPEQDKDLAWAIKSRPNEDLRQDFLTKYVPRIREIGLRIPDPKLRL